MAESVHDPMPSPRTRRAILAAALAAAGASVASALGRPGQVRANDPNDVLLGGANVAVNTTSITNSTDDDDILEVRSEGGGIGLKAVTDTGTAVFAGATGSGHGLDAYATSGIAINAASSDNHALKVTSASTTLAVIHADSTATSGTPVAIKGESAYGSGTGVYGLVTSTTLGGYGVHGRSTGPSGRGVYGVAIHGSGTTIGVLGQVLSPNGTGVFGRIGLGPVPAAPGAAVHGYSSAGIGSRGVLGETDDGNGVEGVSYFGNGIRGSSTDGIGVYGSSAADDGVKGESVSGRGVYGLSTSHHAIYGSSGSGSGVFGQSASSAGVFGSGGTIGSLGTSVSGIGVKGTSQGIAPGVLGQSYGDSVGIIGSSHGAVEQGPPAVERTGVYGVANQDATSVGVRGSSEIGSGVLGFSGSGAVSLRAKTGVYGQANHGSASVGVRGHASGGKGVFGSTTSGTAGYFSTPKPAEGVHTGFALRAVGRVKLDRCAGVATIAVGQTSVAVTPGIDLGSTSAIVATLMGSAGGTTNVHRVSVNATTNVFTIVLTAANTAASPVKVAWHVFG